MVANAYGCNCDHLSFDVIPNGTLCTGKIKENEYVSTNITAISIGTLCRRETDRIFSA